MNHSAAYPCIAPASHRAGGFSALRYGDKHTNPASG